jgi:hypothetical protein
MKRFTSFLVQTSFALTSLSFSAQAQTGPGGIGSSTDLLLWLRADKGALNASGIPATGTQRVATWQDQSGNNRHFTQTDNTLRPRIALAGVNGQPGIEFAGNGDFLLDDDGENYINGLNNFTLMMVVKSDVTNTDKGFWICQAPAGNDDIFTFRYDADGVNGGGVNLIKGGIRANAPANQIETSNNSQTTNSQLLELTWSTGQQLGVRINGSVNTPTAPSTNIAGPMASATQVIIGKGGKDAGANSWDGDIAEVILFNRTLTNFERIIVSNNLTGRYGTSLSSLPSYYNQWTVPNYEYKYNVIGLGRMGSEQVNTVNNDGLVNLSAVDPLNDNSFIFMGANSRTISQKAGALPFFTDMLAEGWAVEVTGNVGQVKISIAVSDFNAALPYHTEGDPVLIVSSNRLFTNFDQYIQLTNVAGRYEATVDFANNAVSYYTFGVRETILRANGVWRGGMGPNGEPTTHILDWLKTIRVQENCTMNTSAQVYALRIDPGVDFTIGAGECLTITNSVLNQGNVILESTGPANYAQYRGPALDVEFRMTVNGTGWHNLTFPVSGTLADIDAANNPATFNMTGNSNTQNVWKYNGETCGGSNLGFTNGVYTSVAWGTWDMAQSTDNLLGRGYSVYLDGNFGGSSQTISMSGTTHTGNLALAINQGYGGWNLIGNPYTTALDWDAVYADASFSSFGISPAYFVWDPVSAQYLTYDAQTGTSFPSTASAGQYIAPGQAFYVLNALGITAISNCLTGVPLFPPSTLTMKQSHLADCAAPSLNKISGKLQKIRFRTDGANGLFDEVVFALDPQFNDGFSGSEDVAKLFKSGANQPKLFNIQDSMAMAIDKFATTNEGRVLAFEAPKSGKYTLTLDQFLFDGKVYLEDLKTGAYVELQADDVYGFQYQQGDAAARFLVHFQPNASTEITLGTEEVSPAAFVVKKANGTLSLEWPATQARGMARLVDITGRVLWTTEWNQPLEVLEVDMPNQSGIYILQTETAAGGWTEKINW